MDEVKFDDLSNDGDLSNGTDAAIGCDFWFKNVCTKSDVEEVHTKPPKKNYESILPHVFWLLKPPDKSSAEEVVLEEACLLELFSKFLSFGHGDGCPFPRTLQAFHAWQKVQDGQDEALLAQALAELKTGQSLPLYVRAQNAGVLFTLSDACLEGHQGEMAVVSTFATAKKAVEVSSKAGDLMATFPLMSIHVPRSRLLAPKVLARQLISLNKHMLSEAMTKMVIANQVYADERDVADPMFVAKWLCGSLCDMSSCLCTKIPRISKKVRDEVVLDSGMPFRRSGLWMAVKVVLQLKLAMELGEVRGRQTYKMILLEFMCGLCGIESLAADVGVQMMAKIARRLYKLRSLGDALHPACQGPLDKLHREVEVAVGRLRRRLDAAWKTMAMEHDRTMGLQLLGSFDFPEDSKHSLEPLKKYLESRSESKKRGPPADDQSYKGPSPPMDQNVRKLSEEPFAEQMNFQSKGVQALRKLYCFEYRVLRNLRLEQTVEYGKVGETFLSYLAAAETAYQGDRVGISRAVLVCLRILQWVDKSLCESYSLMKDHKTDIPIHIIEHLMLPFGSELKVAHDIETYFMERRRGSRHPSLLAPYACPLTSLYSVRHAERDAGMQLRRKEILAEGVRKTEEKMAEVRREKEKWEALKSRILSMPCKCTYNSYCRRITCEKCHLKNTADNMLVSIYEKPLPQNVEIQNAIVFELMIPEPIFYFREMLRSFLVHLDVLPSGQCCRAMWPNELSHHKSSHSGSLAVSLGSRAAPKNRYHPRELHPQERESQFVVENSGDVQLCVDGNMIQPVRTIPEEVLRRFVFRVEPGSPYASLQWALDDHSYAFSDNQVLARQHECPSNLSLTEFKEFGSVRAGHRIQLRNLYRAMKQRTLSLKTESVLNLVYEVLWRAGPPSDDRSLPAHVRQAHVDLFNKQFLTEFLNLLDDLISTFSKCWDNHPTYAAIVAILLRVSSLTEDCEIRTRCFGCLQKCREILQEWCRSIEKAVDTMEKESVAEQNKMRMKLIAVATLCCCTYWSDVEWTSREGLVDYVKPWLMSAKTIQEYLLEQDSGSETFWNQLRRFRECSCAKLDEFHKFAVDVPAIMQAFTRDAWAGYSGSDVTWTCCEGGKQWFTAQAAVEGGMANLRFDLLEGHFLVDGKPQDHLPSELKNHDDYRRIFGDFVVKVQPLKTSPWSTGSKHSFRGQKMRFKENPDFQATAGASLYGIFSEIDSKTWEYVPEGAFADVDSASGESVPCMQQFLVREHTHWWREEERCIAFRSKKSHKLKYRLDLDTGLIEDETVPWRLAMASASPTFDCLMKVFLRLEQKDFVEIHGWASEPEELDAQLPRMGLHFRVAKDGSGLRVESLEYPGMRVATGQQCGTLVGLRSGLLLQNPERGFGNKLLLVTHGDVSLPDGDGDVMISSVSLRCPPYFAYEVDHTLRQLKGGQTKSASAYLAYLHALTSHPLPDPLTGHTGTERALQLLQSGHCWSCEPYNEETARTLALIAELSPQRKYTSRTKAMTSASWPLPGSMACSDAFRMVVAKLLSDSQRLSALFECTLDAKQDSENEAVLCEKGYWRHFKCTTEQAHISPGFLAMKAPATVESAGFDCGFVAPNMKAVLEVVCLVDAWSTAPYASGSLHHSLVNGRKTLRGNGHPFPQAAAIAEWLNLEFWDSWISLYNLAKRVGATKREQEWKMLLTSYAFRGIAKEQLVLLQTIAVHPEKFYFVPPVYGTYVDPSENTLDDSKVRKVIKSNIIMNYDCFFDQQQRLGQAYTSSAMRNLYDNRLKSQINAIIAKLQLETWPFRSCRSVVDACSDCSFLDVEEIEESVDILLNKWSNNYELQQFIDKVEKQAEGLRDPSHIGEFDATDVCRRLSLEADRPACNGNGQLPFEFGVHSVPANAEALDDGDEARVAFQKGEIANSRVPNLPRQQENTANKCRDILSDPERSDGKCKIWGQLVSCLESEGWSAALTRHEELCAEAQLKYWRLAQAMITTGPLVKLLATAGIFQRLTPLTLLPLIRHQDSTLPFMNWLRDVLGAFGVAETCKRHASRCLRYLASDSQFELDRELACVPHQNWSPAERPEWLLLEIDMDLLVRPVQKQVAEQMENPEGGRNAVTQLNMGEGKTAVITPLLVLSLANGQQLCRVTVLRSLYNTNKQALNMNLGGLLLSRRVYSFPCRRDIPLDAGLVRTLWDVYQECVSKGGVTITTPEYRLSFQLKTYEQCRIVQNEVAPVLLEVQKWLMEKARDVLDESDEILHVKYQMVYALGLQMPPVGGSQRWTVLQRLLDHVRRVFKTRAATLGKGCTELLEDPSEVASFPHCRLLKMDAYESFCQLLTDEVLSGTEFPNLEAQDKALLRTFLTNKAIDSSTVQRVLELFSFDSGSAFYEKALILRGLMACGVLFTTLSKRWRVNYGVNPKGRTPLAVPFRAKDVAAERTEFGHPDVALVLTHLSYYYSGLSESQVTDCLLHVMRGPNPDMEYAGWTRAVKDRYPSIVSLRAVNLDDHVQRKEQLFPALRKNKAVIDYWLANIVLPVKFKQFPEKITCTAWDLASHQVQKPTTGFSGTNDTQVLLPLTVAQRDLPELQQTNFQVFQTLLLEENNSYESLPPGVKSVDILQRLVDRGIPLLLDVGALMLDLNNEAVAEKWLKLVSEDRKKAAIYFSADDRLMVKDRSPLDPVPFEISPYRSMLDQCVVYLDDVHTRGTDLKLPAGIKGCVTLGKGVTKDKLVQGCMRLRKLGKGHTVCFWASDEVDNEIAARAVPGRDLVLKWALNNSRNALKEGFAHWVVGALNYLKKTEAQASYGATAKTHSDRENLAKEVSVDEVTGLTEMYGTSLGTESFSEFTAQLMQKHCPVGASADQELSSYRGRVIEHCKTYVPDLEKDVHDLLDEEQERELEQEQEEEREMERPGAAEPHTPKLDVDMVRFLEAESKVLDCSNLPTWLLRLPEGLRYTRLKDYETAAWGDGVYITADFLNTVKSQHAQDSFLRTVNWFASFGVGGSQHWLLMSPFEVNSLIKHFRHNELKASLHMYCARLSMDQSTLLELNNLALPVGTSPASTSDFNGLNTTLSIFAGCTFFRDMDEFESYCAITGYVPNPRSAEEQDLPQGAMDNAGFLLPPHHQSLRSNCRFQQNPEGLIVGIIICRYNYFSQLCHVAELVHECRKPDFQ